MPASALRPLGLIALALILLLSACAEGDGSSSGLPGTDNNQTSNNQSPGNQAPNNQTPNNQSPGNQTSNNETPGNQTPGNQSPNGETPEPTTCTDASDCPDGWECDAGTCLGPDCLEDDDCGADQACAIDLVDPDEMALRCHLDDGLGHAGDACVEHGDCRSRFCLDGQCTAPCQSEGPCAGGDSCLEQAIDRDGHTGVFDLCVPTPFIECQDPDDCQLDGRTCNALTFDAQGDPDGASCGYTYPGEASLGDFCSADNQCESGLCLPLGGADGDPICTVFCTDAQAHCGSDQVCPQMLENHGLCSDACDTSDDCPTGQNCIIAPAMDGPSARHCRSPIGDAPVGDPCETNRDCATDFCVAGFGTQSCTGDANCPGAATCECPPNNPGCGSSEQVCVQRQCTELCDPAEGHDQCVSSDHDFTQCGDVEVSFNGATDLASACVW